MKIAGLKIRNYKQFKNISIDFTNEKGEPLDNICFIGRNGTGKTIILNIINNFILQMNSLEYIHSYFSVGFYDETVFVFKVYTNEDYFYVFIIGYNFISDFSFKNKSIIFDKSIDENENWFDDIGNDLEKYKKYSIVEDKAELLINKLKLLDNSNDLLIYSPTESVYNNYINFTDVPATNLNDALGLFDNFPFYNEVSPQNVSNFWKMLIFNIKKRENDRQIFENKKENLSKTKQELINKFNEINPNIIDKIKILWDKILDDVGLEIDIDKIKIPVQLTENLHLYVRKKGSEQQLKYNELSTGIISFIFRLGHIASLYFNREIKKGFLLLDEPENYLFPDFLMNLIEIYQEILKDKNGKNNTQIFAATHNPIIASQFEPFERIILELDEDGNVIYYKGKAPKGDDPNDLLNKDFGMGKLMTQKGQEMWQEYVNLQKKLIRTEDKKDKEILIRKILKIGELYNF